MPTEEMFPAKEHVDRYIRTNPPPKENWYYLHDLVKDKMYVLSDLGNDLWVDHDTVRKVPHLFSTAALAHQKKRQLKCGTVKKYHWQHRL